MLNEEETMFAVLEATRLNVDDKSRSNLFSWRGQFTPQFVDYLLETYARPGQRVLDPFCGSGTVLQEAASHGLAATGFEINPAAYAMAKFFSLCGLSHPSRVTLVKSADEVLRSVLVTFDADLPLFRRSSDYRESTSNLLTVAAEVLSRVNDKRTKLLLLLCLFRAEGSKNGALVTAVARAFRFLADHLMLLPHSEEAPVAALSDARSGHMLINGQADLIITSPPYINVFNYHQNYRTVLELVGFDMLMVAHSEIGSNRKHRGNRFLTVIQYCLDLELALDSFAKCLVPGGLLIMVLGRESRVRGVAFGNSVLAKALIERNGAYSQCMSHERVFVNRFGQSIYEDILVTRRAGDPAVGDAARNVARSALQEARTNAEGDVCANIDEAIGLSESVKPSPIFNKAALI